MVLAGVVARPHGWVGLDLAGTRLGIALLSPVGEELGWRGYLLPRLDPDAHPLRASVIVGVAWCAWHIPYDGWPSAWMWLWLIALSIIFTQLWRASRRSLAVAVAAHLSIHFTRIFRIAEGTPLWAIAIVAAVAAVAALLPTIRR
jgi:membrane protease YdiL (CAAX protease family)